MKEKIIITFTKQELLNSISEELFSFFKEKITKKYGPDFSFKIDGDSFVAEKEGAEIILSEKVRMLIGPVSLKDVSFRKFFSENFNPGPRKFLERRAFNALLNSAKSMDMSLSDFLNQDKEDLFEFRNLGKSAYLVVCEKFREKGFDTSLYPVFGMEEEIRNKMAK